MAMAVTKVEVDQFERYWDCDRLDCPEDNRHENAEEALECARWELCVCGCFRRWHGIGMESNPCFSPECFDCREFTAPEEEWAAA